MRARIPTDAIKTAMVSRRLQLAVPAVLLMLLCLFPSEAQKMNAQASAGTSSDVQCISNLKRIYRLITLDQHQSAGVLGFPTNFDRIRLMTHDRSIFVCPAEVTPTTRLKRHSFKTSYEVVNDPLRPELAATPRDRVAIVAEKRPNHNGKRFVLFYDGSVRAFDQAQFDKLKDNSFIDIRTVYKNR